MPGRAWMCACCESDRERDGGADRLSTQRKFAATPESTTPHQYAGTLRTGLPFELAIAVCTAARKHAPSSRSTCTERRGKPNQELFVHAPAQPTRAQRLFDTVYDAPSP